MNIKELSKCHIKIKLMSLDVHSLLFKNWTALTCHVFLQNKTVCEHNLH